MAITSDGQKQTWKRTESENMLTSQTSNKQARSPITLSRYVSLTSAKVRQHKVNAVMVRPWRHRASCWLGKDRRGSSATIDHFISRSVSQWMTTDATFKVHHNFMTERLACSIFCLPPTPQYVKALRVDLPSGWSFSLLILLVEIGWR